ncbi:hypothetical protein JTB14_002496 [Gonioctena quinquepunctata]|nr:hypothetical protein JTB14_002496 [Gonioctena quinquepunctata]
MKVITLAILIVCILVSVVRSVPTISLLDSSVPSVSYAFDAVTALTEAYTLYPSDDDSDIRIKSFVELFTEKHKVNGGWNVGAGCTTLYKSNAKYLFIKLNVAVDATTPTTTTVEIFN